MGPSAELPSPGRVPFKDAREQADNRLMAEILTERDEIRAWATARAGQPAIADFSGVGGEVVLRLVFGQQPLNATGDQGPDRPGGLELVSWDQWFDELERHNLALSVATAEDGEADSAFQFVERPGS